MRNTVFLLGLLIAGCNSKPAQDQLVVVFSQISLQASSGKKSAALHQLKAGERLTDLGEVSRFESVISFNDQLYQSPWMLVQTADNRKGWVFCAAVQPLREDSAWLLRKRMLCYFGAVARDRCAALTQSVAGGYTGKTAQDMMADYRKAVRLRDTLTDVLAHRPESGEAGFQPDESWFQEALPGFVFQMVREGRQPYLFADYRFWLKKAQETEDTQDDVYFNTCLALFPADSIESFFPVWTFQTAENKAASMLGSGMHLHILRLLNNAFTAGPLCLPELQAVKESLLEDILDKKTVYWYPADKIVVELNQIIQEELSCLGAGDRIALEARLTMFSDPALNGISVNLRSGEFSTVREE